MKDKIVSFFKKYIPARADILVILGWTVAFFTMAWIVFYLVFGFNILSPLHWHLLIRAWQRGWVVRGLMDVSFFLGLLALIPTYIATANICVRGDWWKKFLKCVSKTQTALKPEPPKSKDKKPAEKSEDTKSEPEIILPENLPEEMRARYTYIAATEKLNKKMAPQTSVEFGPNTTAASEPKPETIADIPENGDEIISDNPFAAGMIPTSFDVEIPNEPDNKPMVFKPINFDIKNEPEKMDENTTDENAEISELLPTEIAIDLASKLNKLGFEIDPGHEYDIDVIATLGDKTYAIAGHSDEKMWIADETEIPGIEPMWFAEGSQKISPAYRAKMAAENLKTKKPAENIQPVLYLHKHQIMNLPEMTETWTKIGVIVITDPSELPN